MRFPGIDCARGNKFHNNSLSIVRYQIANNAYQIYFAVLSLFLATTLAVQTVVIKGSDFVNSVTGDRLQLLGVAYQPGGSSGYNPASGVDPLSDGSVCLRDAALMQRLGVNAIRVYNVDPDLNHDMCASIFNAVRSLCKVYNCY
jgi:hypothetical protein